MAQRDYVRRSQQAPSRRKNSASRNTRKKQSNFPAVSPAMVAIAAAVVVAFIGGLYFITHHKKEESEALQSRQVTGNGLPPKPEERWRYIKELESRQPGVRAPTEPSAGGEVINPNQLTDEQRQLLAQMQADMRQQPTQLTEVPWNEQTPAQRQQTLQRQRLAQQAQQQQWSQQQVIQQPQTRAPQPVQQTHQTQQAPKATVSNKAPYQDLLQTPAHTAASQPKAQSNNGIPEVREVTPPPKPEKKDDRRWMVQCGSFKGAEQAETVRAQLAFEGFDSRITTNNGWNRVVIGPVKGKENVDNTIARLKLAGHGNCIRLASGG
ncbi:cell division protein FtsN [Kluyvera ascorbata]|uniref:cell division protein FtsN n=1 Tax=Kluyvera ascorbata TaxID=51288 RepID=UPI0022DEF023|nr:cell division protein FtsN [Kluyvera ascorbata]